MTRLKQFVSCLTAILCVIVGLCIPTRAENAVYRNTSVSTKKIALTFDDGPHPSQTQEILNILKENDIHATFFVIGINVTRYPEPISKILSGGHEIGNHTFSHCNVGNAGPYLVANELLKCENAIYEVAEYRPKLFRPPEGSISKATEDLCTDADYSVILWSVDTRDWAHRNADEIVADVLLKIQPGDIILMHDYIGGYSPTTKALRKLIPELKRQGYEFCTVSELLEE